ncbi:MAG: hypothetical protein EFT35_03090 [Methanophagales archaeon ANME-1-THS]|nr:MAG: hypothetical protein EFT35_03090 [Methanophagales archaeon ANME-1-THS]
MNKKVLAGIILGILVIFVIGCIEKENTEVIETPKPTAELSPTPSLSPILSPTIESSPTPSPTPTPEPIITYKELPFTGAKGGQLVLINNRNATNPTFDELRKFLVEDKTNEHTYSYGSFICGDFAEVVHNNAEAKGIRAGLVTITFSNDPIGHAINVFTTKDRGLIYVDCTGEGYESKLWKMWDCIRRDVYVFGCADCSYDKLAYISKGKEYGAISTDVVQFNTDYDYYSIYKYNAEDFSMEVETFFNELEEYNEAMREYNEDVINFNTYWSSYPYYLPEDLYNEYSRQKDELDARGRDLSSRKAGIDCDYKNLKMREETYGCAWESLGIVEDIEIYW